jgi:DNA-directed RNA polymerase specialized sigma24 family protein
VDAHETWTAEQCAAAWGVKTPTWLGYVSRAQAPPALPERDAGGRRLWDADEVRRFPRPGSGRSRAGASDAAGELLAQMHEVAEQLDALRRRQRELLQAGKEQGLEIAPMAAALGISRQTAYSWLDAGR